MFKNNMYGYINLLIARLLYLTLQSKNKANSFYNQTILCNYNKELTLFMN